MSSPRQVWRRQIDFDGGDRRNWLPDVYAPLIERVGDRLNGRRIQLDLTFYALGKRHRHFINVNCQTIFAPLHATRTNSQQSAVAHEVTAPTLCHRPSFAACAVKCDVHRNMVERIAQAFVARARVVGREYAADQRDDRQPVPSIVT